jgi:hypothetical protein
MAIVVPKHIIDPLGIGRGVGGRNNGQAAVMPRLGIAAENKRYDKRRQERCNMLGSALIRGYEATGSAEGLFEHRRCLRQRVDRRPSGA